MVGRHATEVGMKRALNLARVFCIDNLHVIIGIVAGLTLALTVRR